MIPTGLPSALRKTLGDFRWERQTIGRSVAEVYRLIDERSRVRFLKTAPNDSFNGLTSEAARLEWLRLQGIGCPEVLEFITENGGDWMLTSALSGQDAASIGMDKAPDIVATMADGLRTLHALDWTACPFNHALDRRVTEAGARVAAQAVEESDFDEKRLGRSAGDLFAELSASRPNGEDLVVTHGDACLPNFILENGKFSGFVDCGRLGVADRYQDLALACRSTAYNLGAAWTGPFLQAYGLPEADPALLEYYQLLDEFF